MTATAIRRRGRVATVLVVDDERNVTAALTAVLRTEPYEVLTVHSGGEALAVLGRVAVNAIVSDEHMPGMTGCELLAIAARDFPRVGRIMLTGRATLDVAMRAINQAGIVKLLGKPASPQDLRAAIAEAIRAGAVSLGRSGGRGPSPWGLLDPVRVETLSGREREVLELLIDGLRLSQIAKALFVSPHTVRNHLKSVFEKLGVHSQVELLSKGRGACP